VKDVKELRFQAKGFSVLYVEDNDALRVNASKVLKQFFEQVYVACDGREGLEYFKKYHPDIVVTDVVMPYVSGLEMSRHIHMLNKETKIIVMSGDDSPQYLFEAIELGIFRFLKKPVNVLDLKNVLSLAVQELKEQYDAKLFYTHLKSIFNYQSSMVMMIDGITPVLVNQVLLDFFHVETMEKFIQNYKDIGSLFLPHSGFLYNKEGSYWFDAIRDGENKLFHVKLESLEHVIQHYICKYQRIPDKQNYGILSFDDITELHLLKLFDEKQSKNDENLQDTKALFSLLEVLQRNSAKLSLHNYYKGLSITNNALIADLQENTLVLREKNSSYHSRGEAYCFPFYQR